MAHLKICRVCINTETRMYHLDSYDLKQLYEDITQKQIANDNLPQYLCYECSTLLQKYHKFKQKCQTGSEVLQELYWNGELTYEAVDDLDRKYLKSSLEKIKVTERVKTFDYQENENDSINNDNKRKHISEVIEEPKETKSEMHVENLLLVPKTEDKVFIDENIHLPDQNVNPLDKAEDDLKMESDNENPMETDYLEYSEDEPLHKLRKRNIKKIKPASTIVDGQQKGAKKKKYRGKSKKITREARLLNSNFWKVQTLTDEEAMKVYTSKSLDDKYLTAKYKCTDCFKPFSSADIFRRHKKLRHNWLYKKVCRFCKNRYHIKRQLDRHMAVHFNKYICGRCDFVTCNKNNAFFHDDSHSGPNKTCPTCGQQFRHTSSFYTHLRLSHKSDILCTICGAAFVSVVGLNMHKNRIHFDHDPEKAESTYCSKCDMKFETRNGYEKHFYGSANHPEKRMTANRQPKIGKKPRTCYQCGQHFATQALYFKHHRRVHPGTSVYQERIICEICGASLKPSSVKSHLNVHTKEQTFSCETCGKEFTSPAGLKRHIVTHTGERPHACSLCEKRFTQRGSMLLHYRTAHLKQPYPKRNRNHHKGSIEMSSFQRSDEQK